MELTKMIKELKQYYKAAKLIFYFKWIFKNNVLGFKTIISFCNFDTECPARNKTNVMVFFNVFLIASGWNWIVTN